MQFQHKLIKIICQQFEGISLLILVAMMLTGMLLVQAAIAIYSWKAGKKVAMYRKMCYFVLVCYLCFVFQITFYNRDAGSRITRFMPLDSLIQKKTMEQLIYDELNVALFVPFGLILSFLMKNIRFCKRLVILICISCLTSMGIEVCQFITKRGFFEIADLAMNTAGGFVGGIIAGCMISAIEIKCKLKREKCDEERRT